MDKLFIKSILKDVLRREISHSFSPGRSAVTMILLFLYVIVSRFI